MRRCRLCGQYPDVCRRYGHRAIIHAPDGRAFEETDPHRRGLVYSFTSGTDRVAFRATWDGLPVLREARVSDHVLGVEEVVAHSFEEAVELGWLREVTP